MRLFWGIQGYFFRHGYKGSLRSMSALVRCSPFVPYGCASLRLWHRPWPRTLSQQFKRKKQSGYLVFWVARSILVYLPEYTKRSLSKTCISVPTLWVRASTQTQPSKIPAPQKWSSTLGGITTSSCIFTSYPAATPTIFCKNRYPTSHQRHLCANMQKRGVARCRNVRTYSCLICPSFLPLARRPLRFSPLHPLSLRAHFYCIYGT